MINLGMIYEAWVSCSSRIFTIIVDKDFFVEIVSGSNTCKSDQMQNQ